MDMKTYKDGRAHAAAAADEIRRVLASLGFPDRVLIHIRPMVTHSGAAYVHMGMVRADVAERMAEVIRAGLEAES